MADENSYIEIQGERYEMPTEDDLTLGELAELGRIAGPAGPDGERAPEPVTLAMVYIVMKRRDPKLTLDEVAQLKVKQLNVDEGEDESPPEEAGESVTPATTGSPSTETSSA